MNENEVISVSLFPICLLWEIQMYKFTSELITMNRLGVIRSSIHL